VRARRLAAVVVVTSVLALAGAGAGAVFAAPGPPPQADYGLSHKPVCGPAPSGSARCHAEIVVRPDRKPNRSTTTSPATSSTSTSTTVATTTTTQATTTTTVATTTTTQASTTTTQASTTTTSPAPTCTAAHAGYTPCDLQSAYKLPSSTAGSGQTVAIVDAYDAPTAEADLGVYRSTYGLPACTTANGCFRKLNQSGVQGSYPAADGGWAQEISLDLDMVSAACPNCHIVLVEATSSTLANLATAERTAVTAGAKAISNSYGASETGFITKPDDSAYNVPGVAITVSSGDSGYGVEFPASSGFVTSVGGTSLTRGSNARGWTETAWSGAGSGCSAFFTKPSWQTDSGCARRMVADVSAVANPSTGVAVYDSYAYQGQSGWLQFGGTSVASPIVAAVYALAGNMASFTYGSYPYSHRTSLYDVTSGNNGTCVLSPAYFCTAGAGYDGPTGLGTPQGTGAF
jgi:subtilase family serine protease